MIRLKRVRGTAALVAGALLAPAAGLAAIPVAGDSTTWVILNHGRPAGDLVVVRNGDSLVVRYIFVDRNRGTRLETRYRLAPNGDVLGGESRPIGADGRAGDPSERFEVKGDSARWTTFGGRGRGGAGGAGGGGRGGAPGTTIVRIEQGGYVSLRGGGTPWEQAMLARFLLRQPGKSAKILPGGATARLEIVADTTVTTSRGRQRVRLAMISSANPNAPNGIWLDDRDALFATGAAWFITVRPGAERALPALRAAEIRYRNARAEALARRLTTPVNGALVIRNGDLFDSERGIVAPRTTIVVRGDRIVAVGPADSVPVPAGATVIDALGKTVVPGLWEMHTHVQVTSQSSGSVSQLAQGITTARDVAADLDVAVSQRDRERAGRLASPRMILAGFIEGPERWAGPSEVLVSTETEARAWVARYDSLGYKQIKLYNLVHPDLVPTIAEEAHKRGMRLSGHVPRGLSVPAAVLLGFDEIQHAAFLFSTFYQDSLYVPTMRPYSAVATAVAPNVNVDGPEMSTLIALLRDHRTVIDGTFNIWIGGGGAAVGGGPSANLSKADSNYLRLIRRLYDGGVTLVAGTDNGAGTTYHRELALYEQAGIPAPQVLQIATIVAARVMQDDRDYGSIATGKVADLVIVNGKPHERVADLGKLETVIRAGRVYAVKDLTAALRAP
ncbi:MAG TPA: amidohydrolase family protein [Gemmatimonadaceae bacterium]|nr:amidohydrolase family protein [Gemmatimonadaceae bacterium]